MVVRILCAPQRLVAAGCYSKTLQSCPVSLNSFITTRLDILLSDVNVF